MKLPFLVLLGMMLAACGQGKDNKPLMPQERSAMDKASQVDNTVRQQTEKQQQEVDKQTQ